MTFDQGDVVLIPFPFTDLSAMKRRPVLVLSNRSHNRRSQDFIVCGITSVIAARPHSVTLRATDMDNGMIPVESRIRPDKIFTLKQTLAVKKIGRVKPDVIAHVKSEIMRIIA
jgi:mRNA interferase MazF